MHDTVLRCLQVPGTGDLPQLAASMATSAAVDTHGQLLMWGTDTMSSGSVCIVSCALGP